MPPGRVPWAGESYSYVSTISGNGVCTQSVRITSRGDGTPPQVERHSSGNCGAAAAPQGRLGSATGRSGADAPPKQPDLILTQDERRQPLCRDGPARRLGPLMLRWSAAVSAASGRDARDLNRLQASAASMPRATASRRRSPPCSPTIISPTGASPGFWIGTVAAQRSRKLIVEQLRRISAFSRR